MRDLINLLDNLVTEARGLSARQPGEKFSVVGSDSDQDTVVFQGMDFYPDSGRYETTEDLLTVFDRLQKKLGHPIERINQPIGQGGGFALVQFDTAVGRRYLAKFAKDIKPAREQNTFFQTKDIPGNFSQVGARGSKEKVGYKPSEVLTNFKSQTPATIIQQIGAKFGTDSSEYQAAVIFNKSTSFPVTVPAGNMDFAAFRDYFCEMLQPIALINEMPIKGNANKAAEIFLGGNYSDCVVSFNQGVGGELYDSLLVAPNGKQIKLSSKGAKGAMASSVNLLKSVRELAAAGMTQFSKLYADVIEILETINRGDHNSGPLNLAIEQGMITADESRQVMSLKQYAGQKNFNIDNTDLSDNLKTIYKERKAEDPSKIVPMNHMVSSIAYKVVNYINMNTNFSEASADILNNSAFVQMYTEAKKKDDQIIIQGFTTVWPSKLFTEVTLEAQKSYSSTSSSGGKLVFNINKEPKVEPNVENGATTNTPGPSVASDMVDYIPQRTGITARGDTKEKPQADTAALGRKRR